MPDIKAVVKKMIEDGESEDVIDAVVKKMQSGSEIKSGLPDMSPAPPPKDEYTGPDTFWGGFRKSLFGDEFNQTAQKSLKGFAKGTADIPNAVADLAQGVASGVHSLIEDPAAHFRAAPEAFREMGRGIRDITKNAGADPEAFGHMSGQIFGQPLFTEGLLRAPAISKAAKTAIIETPWVNKALSGAGKMLEGTRDPKLVPLSSRGLISGAVRGVARPIGKSLQRVGERGRLGGGTRPPSSGTNIKLKGETETPHSPDSDIFAGGGEGAVRPRPIRRDPRVEVDRNTEFTRPVTETAEQLAARNRPSVFTAGQSSRNQSTPFEPRPVDTTPYEPPPVRPPGIQGEAPIVRDTTPYPVPGETPPGIPGEAPILRDTTPYAPPPTRPLGLPLEPPPVDPFAPPVNKVPLRSGRLKQNRRNQSMPYEPSVDPFAPPVDAPPIGVGEGGPSSRFRSAPYEPGEYAAARAEAVAPKPKAPTTSEPAPTFEPSVDPATNFSPEDIALMQSRRAELQAVLEKMSKSENVDTTTGEILEPTQSKGWRQSEPDVNTNEFDLGPDELGVDADVSDPSIANDAGRQFAQEVESSTRYPGDEAFDIGDMSLSSPRTPSPNMPDWGPSDLPSARPVNPLRPEVPPGQVSNRSMFELSERRALENRIANQNTAGRQFAEDVSPGHEFDTDMMMLPDEYAQPDIPPMRSPVENQFDPRISNLDQLQSRTIAPEEWGDWGPDADIPTLVPDEAGSHVAAPNEEVNFAGPEDIFDTADDKGPKNFPSVEERAGRLVKPGNKSVIPEGFQKQDKRPVGPKGASYRVKDPSGKHLGDINVTPKDIAEAKAMGGGLEDLSDETLGRALYQQRLDALLEKHGFDANEAKVNIEPKTTRTKDIDLPPVITGTHPQAGSYGPMVGSQGMESLTDFSGTGREPRFPGDKSKGTGKSAEPKLNPINPDKDFGPGGDIGAIVQEVQRLDYDKAVDSKYRSLLPKEMRTDLLPGETYKGKLQNLIKTVSEHDNMNPEAGAQRLAEMDAFNQSLMQSTGAEGPATVPLLPKFSKIDRSQLSPGKLDKKQDPWYSPRMEQQFPDLVRKRKLQDKLNKK